MKLLVCRVQAVHCDDTYSVEVISEWLQVAKLSAHILNVRLLWVYDSPKKVLQNMVLSLNVPEHVSDIFSYNSVSQVVGTVPYSSPHTRKTLLVHHPAAAPHSVILPGYVRCCWFY